MMKDGAAAYTRKVGYFFQESCEIIVSVIQTLIALIYLVSRVGKITVQDLTAIAVVRQNGRLLEKSAEI